MATWNQGDTAKLTTVVIAENNAPCDVPFAHLRGLAFLRQQPDENLDALRDRVTKLIDRTRSEELFVQRAWFLVNGEHDDQRFITRGRIARMLGDAVRRSRGRGVTIVAPSDLSGVSRAATFSLAGNVLEGDCRGHAQVHVKFAGTSIAQPLMELDTLEGPASEPRSGEFPISLIPRVHDAKRAYAELSRRAAS